MNLISPVREINWTQSEKKIARRVFESALSRQLASITARTKQMLEDDSADVWAVHDYLTQQRKEIDRVYDYRYSMLIFVFARLLRDGWVRESDLDGLSREKVNEIQHIARIR